MSYLAGVRSYLRTLLRGRRLVIGVVIGLVVVVAGANILRIVGFSPVEWWFAMGHAAEDAAELKQICMAMKAYSNENRDLWPVATSTPVALPDLSTFEGKLLDGPDGVKLLDRITGKSEPRLCYLGYVTSSEAGGQAVLDHWLKPSLPGEGGKDIALDAPVDMFGDPRKEVYRLKEGIERFFITDKCNPAASSMTQARIPALWEMPTAKRPGGLVLYMDMHVEWMPYPGEYPMSPAFIERVRRMIDGQPELSKDPAASPVRGIADRVAGVLNGIKAIGNTTSGWWVDTCDVTPAAQAGDAQGYRMILRHSNPVHRDRTLRYIPPSESVACELILFPLDGPAPERGAIRWTTTAPSDASDLTYAGDCRRYRWFTRASVDIQSALRKGIVLTEGDSRGGLPRPDGAA